MADTDPTLLIIEDEPILIDLIAAQMERAGFRVLRALDAKSGMRTAQDEKPDMILLDLMLPNYGGEQLLADLKADDKTKNIPVVIMTNFANSELESKCRALGCVEYIIKANYRLDELVVKIKEICERYCRKTV